MVVAEFGIAFAALRCMKVLAGSSFLSFEFGDTDKNTYIVILASFSRASLLSLLVDFGELFYVYLPVIISICGCDASVLLADRTENGTGLPDPTIPADFLEELKRKCPDDSNTINFMFNEHRARGLSESAISIETSVDNHYYNTLMRGRGLLFADQQLMANEKTAAAVTDYAFDDGSIFRTQFAHAMGKMSNFGALTGTKGEVRHSCSHLNSDQ
ncbi:peroxidase 49-like [Solanum dulcamara]|uniref:peroxidase 49-like n=1 Tax=Solanum dulcamara TaxID=45834 RepID=UPI0024857879|nr:peroxidase 49-like [Solanum dulcamara]